MPPISLNRHYVVRRRIAHQKTGVSAMVFAAIRASRCDEKYVDTQDKRA